MTDPERIGRYQLLRRLGQGGMAEVFLARQEGPSDFQKTVVVKRMLAHLADSKKSVDMFLREARIAARLNHQNVVQLFELGQDNGTYFLAMEYIDGITLHRLAKRAWSKGKALPTEVIVRAIADAALGLHHAHNIVDETGKPAGLVHRDISPDNLMLTKDGVTKVLDFGIAKGHEQKSGVTKTGELKGKIPYMSPEQIQGHPLDPRTDLFSLGVTFYWLLCGKRPFDAVTEVMTLKRVLEEEAQPPSTVNKTVPHALDRIIMKLLEKDPKKRYESGFALHEKLVGLLGGDSASRGPAQELVAEIMALPDPEDDDDNTVKAPRRGHPASMPISATFAPTTVTRASEPTARRGALIGVTAAAVVGFAGAIALLVLNTPVTNALDAGTTATTTTTPATTTPATTTPATTTPATTTTTPAPPTTPATATATAAAPATTTTAPPTTSTTATATAAASVTSAPPSEPEPRADPVLRAVTLKGPPFVTFKIAGAPKRGGGSVHVKPGVHSIVAFDNVHQSTHTVPIVSDVADFGSLGTGTLVVRAVPFAQIAVGSEADGQTPPPKPISLAPGEYTVTLTWEGKVKPVHVVIERGKTAELRVKMNE